MSTWGYSAINAQGLEMNGEIEANDANAAREQLRSRGLMASSLRQLGGSAAAGDESASAGRFAKKIKPKALLRVAVGHHDQGPVALRAADERERRPGAAARVLDHRSKRPVSNARWRSADRAV